MKRICEEVGLTVMDVFLKKVINLYELLNKGFSIPDTLDQLFVLFKEEIPFDRISVVIINNDGAVYTLAVRNNYPATAIKKGYAANLADSSLGQVIAAAENRIIDDYLEYLRDHPRSEATKAILEDGIRSSIASPLIINNICIGVLMFSSRLPFSYRKEHLPMAQMIANNIAITIEKNFLVDDLLLVAITGFARLVEAKDSDTGLHLDRMQNYSRIIARNLAKKSDYQDLITEQYIEDIYKFSPLHDIGKVGIADGILLKPAKLSPEEFEVMKVHTLIGAEVLMKASNAFLKRERHFFDMGIQICLGHHEKYNGKGYPSGIAGRDIPLCARIVTAADVLDALTSKRVYKQSYDLENSLQIIADESGKSFDPDVVAALMESREEIVGIFQRFNETLELV